MSDPDDTTKLTPLGQEVNALIAEHEAEEYETFVEPIRHATPTPRSFPKAFAVLTMGGIALSTNRPKK